MPIDIKRTILITGCSEGGMGAALAISFHNAGHHVFATARNLDKMTALEGQGITTMSLDITSASSISSAVSAVRSALPTGIGLDMLINNAASSYSMPIVDVSLEAAKELYEVNVWAQIAVTQAFLPLLLNSASQSESRGPSLIVNHTSVGSITALPFQGIYNSSKAALAMITETMRLELSPFGIQVIDLKTAGVKTNIILNNNVNTKADQLPKDSIYDPAREVVEHAMSQEELSSRGISAEQWAKEVSAVLLGPNPPKAIWRGESALLARIGSMLPGSLFEGMIKKMTKLDVVEQIIRSSASS